MAKTAKLKKKQAAPHSRAARRAASPSLPIAPAKPARSSTSPSRPSEAKHHILSTQNGGITKKKSPKLTRAQRVRAAKAMERAADDMDKWEKKKAKSIEKAKGIKERAKLWDDVNGETVAKKRSALAALADEGADPGKKESVWVDVGDEEMDDPAGDGAVQPVEAAAPTGTAAPVEEDELL